MGWAQGWLYSSVIAQSRRCNQKGKLPVTASTTNSLEPHFAHTSAPKQCLCRMKEGLPGDCGVFGMFLVEDERLTHPNRL